MADAVAAVRALVFDVFGTVVDWRGSVLRELVALGGAKGIGADWDAFVDDWRAGYPVAMDRVRKGELPWTRLDDLHRMILNGLLEKHAVTGLSEDEIVHLNKAWHRLDPWPDAVAGLTRLKRRFTIAPLSNGNVSLLTAMAKHAGLPWDCVLSAELARHYKPDPEAYLFAASILDLRPEQVMMVAAHPGDLAAAAAQGLRTAYVHRPLERGPHRTIEPPEPGRFDVQVNDFGALSDRLGA